MEGKKVRGGGVGYGRKKKKGEKKATEKIHQKKSDPRSISFIP
jgi:hypothetical protein